MASVFYANRFPEARIIAIEPERSNFAMLKKNAAYYPNILPIQGALWGQNVELNLSNPGAGNWGYQTREHRASDNVVDTVNGITIDKIMEQYGCEYIDILKVDIEGAEKEVFDTSACWIDRVGTIIVELHDRAKNGCSRSVYSATRDFEHEWRKGELTFFAREEYVPSASIPIESVPASSLSSAGRRTLKARILSTRNVGLLGGEAVKQ
jgi:FkbM family methyltransferase